MEDKESQTASTRQSWQLSQVLDGLTVAPSTLNFLFNFNQGVVGTGHALILWTFLKSYTQNVYLK